MSSLAGTIVRRRGATIGCALAAALLLAGPARRVERRLDASGRVEGSPSEAVARALASDFESPFARVELAVLTGVPAPDTAQGKLVLRQVVAALAAEPGVTRTYSHLDRGEAWFLPAPAAGSGRRDGTFVVVGLDPTVSADDLLPRLRTAGTRIAQALRRHHPRAGLRWTGEASLNLDLRRTSTAEIRAAEARALPLTLALLLLAFGSPLAAALPLAAGLLSTTLALGIASLLTTWIPLSITLQSVVSMLGLGLGIDYALLIVGRQREGLQQGESAAAAAEASCRHAGGTVLVSGLAVAIGFLGLVPTRLGELRSVGLGGLLVVGVSVALATTLLPAALAGLGRHLDAGSLRALRPIRALAPDAETWRRFARHVTRRPLLVLALAGLPLLLLAAEARRLRSGLPDGDWLPPATESAAAVRDLRSLGRSAAVQELRVLVELPEDVPALSVAGWQALGRLERRLASDPRVDSVRSLRSLAGERADDLGFVSFIPGPLKHAFVSSEGNAALLLLTPREQATPSELARLARELRAPALAAAMGVEAARLRVGGLPAFNADYEDAVAGRFFMLVAVLVGGTLAALCLAFRSPLLALKAVALNLLSVGAAFGALVLVFQDGHGEWLSLAAPTGRVFPAVPPLVFAIVFGLSIDYEVFLVARVLEARRSGSSDEEAIAEGLSRTGGLITSAAAIMVAVFGAFAWGELLLVKMLGFALAVAVGLDATLVRVALGPALLRLGGRFNWWPAALR